MPTIDPDWLRYQYVDEGRSTGEIAREVGCNQTTVWRALVRLGIPTRPSNQHPTVHGDERYGRLVVHAEAGRDKQGHRTYRCVCDCGNEVVVAGYSLRTENTRSCGCLAREDAAELCRLNATHGHARDGRETRTYRTWQAMVARCTYPGDIAWRYYGGRGITVCARWRVFANFLADMGERPEGKTIDRIDGDGNYEPGNCRWATPAEQLANRRLGGEGNRAD